MKGYYILYRGWWRLIDWIVTVTFNKKMIKNWIELSSLIRIGQAESFSLPHTLTFTQTTLIIAWLSFTFQSILYFISINLYIHINLQIAPKNCLFDSENIELVVRMTIIVIRLKNYYQKRRASLNIKLGQSIQKVIIIKMIRKTAA